MEFETKLVKEPGKAARLSLFNQYLEYSSNLKHLLQVDKMRQWIGGSFTTNKDSPRDIDLVTFISYELVEKLESKLEGYKYPVSKIAINVDAYIVNVFPDNHPNYSLFRGDEADWYSWFTRTMVNRAGKTYPKGFIEIYY